MSDSTGTLHTYVVEEGDKGHLVYSHFSRNDLNEVDICGFEVGPTCQYTLLSFQSTQTLRMLCTTSSTIQ